MVLEAAQDLSIITAMIKTYNAELQEKIDQNHQILVKEYSDRISKLERKIESLGNFKESK